ncbi:ABC transporter substrate-binding protein [Pedobacter insulae]|uniref:ABC-type Fe3+-hydroxamate transport system, substrate-binding protein n=1 Tax=Pedobacter insulae TaxID=414048 RepID=A0A1I2YIC8_9SPHI|nr:helical backbone metal receptor [Pedobacter insulae]SFH25423.1 ABC-type Fe3+-hydroxamate transport system, substrate-binding protein [Pedobacter insulae]
MRKSFTDQMGRTITINYPPKKIVSLVPSQSELLFDLGLTNEIIGITKFCIHPIEKFAGCTKVGGTKKLKLNLIRELQPDLIIGNKEENTQSEIEALMQDFPVWMSDITNLEDALHTIHQIGELVDRSPEAAYLNHLINTGFTDLQTLALSKNINKRAAYLIWKDPYMFAGQHTFIDDILRKIGLTNVVKQSRYPSMDLEELKAENCELILLSSEPYPFKEKHIEEIEAAFPHSKVMLVDGEMFSWYGSRLVKAVEYLFYLQDKLVIS